MNAPAETTRIGPGRTRRDGLRRCAKAQPPSARRAFTIIELLVAILVISVLIGLLIVAVQFALRSTRRANDQSLVTGIQTGVGLFQNTFSNQAPPLVYDGAPIALPSHPATPKIPGGVTMGPVQRPGGSADPIVATFDRIYQDGGATFLRGRASTSPASEPTPLFDPIEDPRYSKFALPIILGGALGASVDGVDGPGLRLSYTNRDGWIIGGEATIREPFLGLSRDDATAAAYVSADEYAEHGAGAVPPSALNADPDRVAYVSVSGTAIRYYRWEPSSESEVQGTATGPLAYLNIPLILRDPRDWDDPMEPGPRVPEQLRSSSYAIVSAGPNGVFGTEPIDLLRDRLGVGPGVAEEVVRFEAWDDNVVRLGQ
ncbi:MAG: type II secretion system protein [Phycisphaerales bacterium]